MSTGWSLFVIVVTVGSLAAMLWLLIANRKSSGGSVGHDYDGIDEMDNPLPAWWVWLFVITVIFAAGYLAYYPGLGNFAGLSGWTSADQLAERQQAHQARYADLYAGWADMTPAELVADRSAMLAGRRLFINHCSTCHGVTAQGGFGFPDLTDDVWRWGGSSADVRRSIGSGRTGVMPGWSVAMTDRQINETAHYVRQLAGLEHDTVRAEAGSSHYRTFCASCHGPDGAGNPLLGAPALTNDRWLYGSDIPQIEFTIREGRSGVMPAHDGLVGEDKVHLLAAYVESLSDAGAR